MLRRVLTLAVVTLFLVMLAVALVVVWTANDRLWYIDTAGLSATLDMTLSPTGRWVATAVLGALILLSLAALLAEVMSARRLSRVATEAPAPPLTGKSFTYVPRAAPPREETTIEAPAARGRYEATVVGDEVTQRMERSLPPEREPSPALVGPPPEAGRDGADRRE